MLPSGNDAAHSLAEYFGALLKKDKDEQEEKRIKEEKERAREIREKNIDLHDDDQKRRSM